MAFISPTLTFVNFVNFVDSEYLTGALVVLSRATTSTVRGSSVQFLTIGAGTIGQHRHKVTRHA